MGRKGEAASLGVSRRRGGDLRVETRSGWRWPLSLKGSALAVIVLALLAIVVFAVTREATTTAREPIPAVSQSASTPQRPAFTRAEEAYIQALWPIHSEVERSAVRLSLGKIFYKINDMGKADLKARVDDALASFRRAETRIAALQPPPSLELAHDEYLAAVGLFQKSALEVLKIFDDGSDDHLLAAYPLNQEGTNKIREVGARFWQDEFTPH